MIDIHLNEKSWTELISAIPERLRRFNNSRHLIMTVGDVEFCLVPTKAKSDNND